MRSRENHVNLSRGLSAFLMIAVSLGAPRMLTAQVQPCDQPPTQVLEVLVDAEGWNPAIGMEECGRFVIAYQKRLPDPQDPYSLRQDIFVQRFGTGGGFLGPTEVVSDQNQSKFTHRDPSIASSLGATVFVGWIAQPPPWWPCFWACKPGLLLNTFDFDGSIAPTSWVDGYEEFEPSVGTTDTLAVVSWLNLLRDPDDGLVHQRAGAAIQQIADCPEFFCEYRVTQWQPCVAQQPIPNGAYTVVWAHAENDDSQDPFRNIALRVYAADGTILDHRDGPDINDPNQWVNDPSVEDPAPDLDTDQFSPAVSFDELGNIVVCWVGPQPASCTGFSHIYARRFKFEDGLLRDPAGNELEGRPGMFIVDSDPTTSIVPGAAHPTVSLIMPPPDGSPRRPREGSFIVAWNAYPGAGVEIRAQYFDGGGAVQGREFRVNQAPGVDNYARLAKSGQHTVIYGPDAQVVATWYQGSGISGGVNFTMLPEGYYEQTVPSCPCCQNYDCLPCLKGDVDDDCTIDGRDIPPFVNILLNGMTCYDTGAICRADCDYSSVVDFDDIPHFVIALLYNTGDCQGGAGFAPNTDCNANGVHDLNDIFNGASQDCNENFIPDECDVDPADPDGNGLVSNDLNANGVPDECEPDCNSNGVPDDKDIADQTSSDVNANGIPDECEPDCNNNNVPDAWDISQATSDDCNVNGLPDECEADCNENGVPDDCDIDPSDPDGNSLVSADCNNNGNPDECDLSLPPPLGSTDCNSNAVPDECDIASGYSQDANQNGIPDECEGGFAPGGGDGPMGGEGEDTGGDAGATGLPLEGEALDAAWEAYFDWAFAQDWGPAAPLSGAEQFQLMIAKMEELGLIAQ